MPTRSETIELTASQCDRAPMPDEGAPSVNWEKLVAEFDPRPAVAEAVERVFKEDAEILRQLA